MGISAEDQKHSQGRLLTDYRFHQNQDLKEHRKRDIFYFLY